jgi:sulfur carrier protein
MELKINNQTKQFTSDSLTVQTLIDLKFPQTKRNMLRSTIPLSQNKIRLHSPQQKQMIFSSSHLQLNQAAQGGLIRYKSAGKNLK